LINKVRSLKEEKVVGGPARLALIIIIILCSLSVNQIKTIKYNCKLNIF
jgi:hypothetical protein